MPTNTYIVTSKVRIILFYFYLVAVLALASVVTKVVVDNRNQARESHRALCTLQADRHKRVEQTEEVLKSKKPEDVQVVKALGKTILLRSLASAKADERALKDISC